MRLAYFMKQHYSITLFSVIRCGLSVPKGTTSDSRKQNRLVYFIHYTCTVRCHYNMVNFLLKAHKIHPSEGKLWGVFVSSNSKSDLWSAAGLYVLSQYIRQRYNSTQRFYFLYVALLIYKARHRQFIFYINGLVQDCSNASALAIELLQSCTKPSICCVINLQSQTCFIHPFYFVL